MGDFYNHPGWRPKPLSSYPFEGDLFKSFEGKCLAKLLKKMMSDDPRQIPDIAKAKGLLQLIEQGKLNEPETVIKLLNEETIDASDAMEAFPDNEDITLTVFHLNPELMKGAKAFELKRFADQGKIKYGDALAAWPDDQSLILGDYQKDSQMIKFANHISVKHLVDSGDIKAEDALKAFPENKDLIINAYQTNPLFIKDANPLVVNQLAIQGHISFEDALKAFPEEQIIVTNAYQRDSLIINKASSSVVNLLANWGDIKFEDALQAFPENDEIILTACCHKIKSALDSGSRQQTLGSLMEFGQLVKDKDINYIMQGVAGEPFKPKSSELFSLLVEARIMAQQYNADAESNLSVKDKLDNECIKTRNQSLAQLNAGLTAFGMLVPENFLENATPQEEREINSCAAEINYNISTIFFLEILASPKRSKNTFLKQVDEQIEILIEEFKSLGEKDFIVEANELSEVIQQLMTAREQYVSSPRQSKGSDSKDVLCQKMDGILNMASENKTLKRFPTVSSALTNFKNWLMEIIGYRSETSEKCERMKESILQIKKQQDALELAEKSDAEHLQQGSKGG